MPGLLYILSLTMINYYSCRVASYEAGFITLPAIIDDKCFSLIAVMSYGCIAKKIIAVYAEGAGYYPRHCAGFCCMIYCRLSRIRALLHRRRPSHTHFLGALIARKLYRAFRTAHAAVADSHLSPGRAAASSISHTLHADDYFVAAA